MFEHFGLLDIWSGFKRYKYIISTIVIGTIVLLAGKFLYSMGKSSDSKSSLVRDDICVSSASYYIDPSVEILGVSDSNFYKSIPDDYVAMLKTDFCRKYIFENLISMYSNDYIIKNSGIESVENNELSNLNIDSMKELYSVKKISNTMLIEVSSMTYDQELSDSVRDICEKFIMENVDGQIINSSIKLSGETSKMIKSSDIALENIDKTDKRNIVSQQKSQKSSIVLFIKHVIIPAALVVLLCIIAIITIGLFKPTLNRASDFSEYEVPLIGEIREYKN